MGERWHRCRAMSCNAPDAVRCLRTDQPRRHGEIPWDGRLGGLAGAEEVADGVHDRTVEGVLVLARSLGRWGMGVAVQRGSRHAMVRAGWVGHAVALGCEGYCGDVHGCRDGLWGESAGERDGGTRKRKCRRGDGNEVGRCSAEEGTTTHGKCVVRNGRELV